MRIFEAAKQTAGLRHYLWSNLDYTFKVCRSRVEVSLPLTKVSEQKSGYDETYRVPHSDGKGRVGEWLRSQPSDPEGLVWSCITSAPYMEMLHFVRLPTSWLKCERYTFAHHEITAGNVRTLACSCGRHA
jgi:hypothetical protein